MELNNLINIIKNSTLEEGKKQELISELDSQGLTGAVKQKVIDTLKGHLLNLEDQAVSADQELKALVSEIAPNFATKFTPEVEKEEQINIITEEAEKRIDDAEKEFNQEKKAADDILDAVESNLQADQTKAIAS